MNNSGEADIDMGIIATLRQYMYLRTIISSASVALSLSVLHTGSDWYPPLHTGTSQVPVPVRSSDGHGRFGLVRVLPAIGMTSPITDIIIYNCQYRYPFGYCPAIGRSTCSSFPTIYYRSFYREATEKLYISVRVEMVSLVC
jgi:hypothetical protein